MHVVLLVLALFLAACQEGTAAPHPAKRRMVGWKTLANISVDEARPYVLGPDGARMLQPPTKRSDREHVIAAYCVDGSTPAATAEKVRTQLMAESWREIAVKTDEDDETGWRVIGATRAGISTSVEVLEAPEQGCNEQGQVAIGVSVYRVRHTR